MDSHLKIVLATDYSDAVMNAERYALQFAKATGSNLCIVHAYDLSFSSTPTNAVEFAKVRDDFYEQAQNTLEQHCNSLIHSLDIKESEVKYECVAREGSPAKVVCTEAEKWQADFIIVGTHGRSGFRNILYGTHAWEIIKKSGKPVLAIPKNGLFTGLKKVVFAIEQRKAEIIVLQSLIKLLGGIKPEINAFHISNYVLSESFEIKTHEDFKKEVNNKIAYEKLSLTLVHNDDIIKGIMEFCLNTEADWLVMSPEKNSLLDQLILPSISTTRRMSFQTRTPLLSIPDYYVIHQSKIPDTFDLNELFIEE